MIAVKRPTLRAAAERRPGDWVLSSTIDIYSLFERGAAQVGDDQDGPVLAYLVRCGPIVWGWATIRSRPMAFHE
jgi:hypothetical protein